MSTIPASQIVNVIPQVLPAGGNALDMVGVMVTKNTRVPFGTIQSFPTSLGVSTYFGATSTEATVAGIYFSGFTNADAVPGSIIYAQFPATDIAAYLRGGVASILTIPQLQGISGVLTVVVDGYSRSATINLLTATSFSAAASLIQTGLNSSPTSVATVNGSIASQSAVFSGSISGNVLTVNSMTSGTIVRGGALTGSGVTATNIQTQLSGTPGGIGTYAIDVAQVINNITMTESYGLLSVTALNSGTVSVDQTVTGGITSANTQITQLGTGSGGTGTYYVNNAQTVIGAFTMQPTPVVVSFDSVSGGFVITSGVVGPASTLAFATGAAATSLMLTAATGAVLSQGSPALTPAAFMNSIVALTQNWATFMLLFDPDMANGFTQRLGFASWTNGQNNRWAFICWDTDISPTQSLSATGSLGYALAQGQYSGTCLIYDPNTTWKSAFICGAAAAIDFNEINGRITFAFKSQSGLVADVTGATVAANLIANGYNFYAAYATANQSFIFLYPGSISGTFLWLDSYINQIWLNNQFQLALMVLLTTAKSIPYNPFGYSLIEAALMDAINQGFNFGAFRSGVTLSSTQAAIVNAEAGLIISTTLYQRGWYLQVLDPGAQVRQARGSPVAKFWYMDGESVQKITLTSTDLL